MLNQLLPQLNNLLGSQHVLTDADATQPYCIDWRKRYQGHALAVVLPASVVEVMAIVQLCRTAQVSIVPQGGNTSLCGGATPLAQGRQIVLSLKRMNQVREIDPINNTITAEAGCILQHVQEAAAGVDRLFPLSLAAEGSCTIGGNLSTNAGGTAVLRYGNARELCLGLEVVTAQGELWNGLQGLRKDNTGYDLRDLLIGAEGTLGIITAATLKLYPQPHAQMTALAALGSLNQAMALLNLAQQICGATLTGFEVMSDVCLQLVEQYLLPQKQPFSHHHAQYVLLEISDNESAEHARSRFETLLHTALQQGLIEDAIVAESIAQSKALWHLRESIPLAQAQDGLNIKHDIAVPISQIASFVEKMDSILLHAYPGIRLVTFGHLGDGNLHYNVAAPAGQSAKEFLTLEPTINQLVYEQVYAHGGSLSAEHGLGQLKRETITHYKDKVALTLMHSIKQALDPMNIMNPGKLL
ncbi:FAD-binding oxidoreductase [Ampullimonas aquatilis]|uniref:FAD-binding oxidoreductase n=1 Tax=Ampullimonas aquatilis TaxID=1341549 RepID=UPI003C712FA5